MKLYATTTSERATKGQGGNKFITINIQDETEQNFVEVRVIPDGTSNRVSVWVKDKLQTTYYNVEKGSKTKGKKQKGEKVPCMNCGSLQLERDIDYLGDQVWQCPNCKK